MEEVYLGQHIVAAISSLSQVNSVESCHGQEHAILSDETENYILVLETFW